MRISNLPECRAQHACLLRCWALSFLSLSPYRGCELLVNQQLSCKDRRLDRQKQTTRSQRKRHAGSTETEGFSISHALRVTLITYPRWMPPEWCGGMAPRDSQKGFTKVAARRPHQRKMNRQHRGKRQREREKYTQDFLQLPTPLHPGTVFKKRQESLTDSEGDLCPGPTGLTSHPSVPLRLHFQSATPLQVDQQRPG